MGALKEDHEEKGILFRGSSVNKVTNVQQHDAFKHHLMILCAWNMSFKEGAWREMKQEQTSSGGLIMIWHGVWIKLQEMEATEEF